MTFKQALLSTALAVGAVFNSKEVQAQTGTKVLQDTSFHEQKKLPNGTMDRYYKKKTTENVNGQNKSKVRYDIPKPTKHMSSDEWREFVKKNPNWKDRYKIEISGSDSSRSLRDSVYELIVINNHTVDTVYKTDTIRLTELIEVQKGPIWRFIGGGGLLNEWPDKNKGRDGTPPYKNAPYLSLDAAVALDNKRRFFIGLDANAAFLKQQKDTGMLVSYLYDEEKLADVTFQNGPKFFVELMPYAEAGVNAGRFNAVLRAGPVVRYNGGDNKVNILTQDDGFLLQQQEAFPQTQLGGRVSVKASMFLFNENNEGLSVWAEGSLSAFAGQGSIKGYEFGALAGSEQVELAPSMGGKRSALTVGANYTLFNKPHKKRYTP